MSDPNINALIEAKMNTARNAAKATAREKPNHAASATADDTVPEPVHNAGQDAVPEPADNAAEDITYDSSSELSFHGNVTEAAPPPPRKRARSTSSAVPQKDKGKAKVQDKNRKERRAAKEGDGVAFEGEYDEPVRKRKKTGGKAKTKAGGKAKATAKRKAKKGGKAKKGKCPTPEIEEISDDTEVEEEEEEEEEKEEEEEDEHADKDEDEDEHADEDADEDVVEGDEEPMNQRMVDRDDEADDGDNGMMGPVIEPTPEHTPGAPDTDDNDQDRQAGEAPVSNIDTPVPTPTASRTTEAAQASRSTSRPVETQESDSLFVPIDHADNMSTIFARLQVAVENEDIPGQQLMMYERGQLWDAMAGGEYCSSLIRSYLVNMGLTPESVGLIVTDEDRRRAFAHDRTRSIAEEVDADRSVQPTTSPNPDGFLNDSMELAPNYDADHDSNPGISEAGQDDDNGDLYKEPSPTQTLAREEHEAEQEQVYTSSLAQTPSKDVQDDQTEELHERPPPARTPMRDEKEELEMFQIIVGLAFLKGHALRPRCRSIDAHDVLSYVFHKILDTKDQTYSQTAVEYGIMDCKPTFPVNEVTSLLPNMIWEPYSKLFELRKNADWNASEFSASELEATYQAFLPLWKDIVDHTACLFLDQGDRFTSQTPPQEHSFVVLLAMTLASEAELGGALSNMMKNTDHGELYESRLRILLHELREKRYKNKRKSPQQVRAIWVRLHEKLQALKEDVENATATAPVAATSAAATTPKPAPRSAPATTPAPRSKLARAPAREIVSSGTASRTDTPAERVPRSGRQAVESTPTRTTPRVSDKRKAPVAGASEERGSSKKPKTR